MNSAIMQRCSVARAGPSSMAPIVMRSSQALQGRPIVLVSQPSQPSAVAAAQARAKLVVQARYSSNSGRGGGSSPSPWGGSMRGTPEILDRALACACYLLPFLNAFVFARFLYHMQPLVRACLKPLMPVYTAYNSIPLNTMICFFGLYIGVANNTKLSRFVRFNAMQALLLDIAMVLPRLVEVVISPPTSGWGAQLYANSQSFIFIFVTVWVVFGMFYSLLGQYGRIPFVAEAAEQQIQ